jgi:hypothetical protein
MKATTGLRAVVLGGALALLSVLTSCAMSSDLSGSIAGQVLSADTGQPIPDARVECDGEATLSDGLGYYSLDGIQPGDRMVTASSAGYVEYSQVVTIGESTQHDILMETFIGQARLYGYVTHSVFGPIEDATVQLGDLSVQTDAAGFYDYPSVQQITYHMTVTKDSFRTFSANVNVTSEDFRYDVGMKKLATVTLEPVADARIDEDQPEQSFGADTELWLFFNSLFHHRFYISFPLDIEDTAEAVDATLRLYNVSEFGEGEARTIQVARVLTAWDEGSVTWNTPVYTTGASTMPSAYEPRWYEIDVTTFFRDWLTGGYENQGLLVDTAQEQGATRFYFASREHPTEDYRPHVVLEYAW